VSGESVINDLFHRAFPTADSRWSAFGIDVSGWQDSHILLGMSGLDLCIVKLSEGTEYRSAEAAQQCADATQAAIPLGLYHFVSFEGVEAEVENLLMAMAWLPRPAMHTAGYAAGIWLDAEDDEEERHVVPDGYAAYLEQMALAVEAATGIPVGIYTAAWWSDGRIDAGTAVSARPLWVADYDDSKVWPNYTNPTLPVAWPDAVGWQFTSRTVEYGPLDLNVFIRSAVPSEAPPTDIPTGTTGTSSDPVDTAGYVSTEEHERWLYLDDPWMSGDDVALLQSRLQSHGYDPGVVDGVFGPNTKAAVVAFQLDHVLVADGIVGTLTFGALDS